MKVLWLTAVLAAATLGALPSTPSSQTSSIGAFHVDIQPRDTLLILTSNAEMARLVERGDSLLRLGRPEEAESLFARVVASAKDSSLLAAATFGRAYTMQSRLSLLPDSARDALADSVVMGYRTAWRLDSVRFFAPAQNNVGVLRLDAGRPKEALPALLAATRGMKSRESSGRYYANVGRAYEALRFQDSAAWAYGLAFRADSSQPTARRALLSLYERSFADDSLLIHVGRMAAANLDLDLSVQALTRNLSRSKPLLAAPQADRAIVLLCRIYASLGMSPEYFERTQISRLNRSATIHPELREAIAAMRGAMAPILPGAVPLQGIRENWWREMSARRLAWSTLLRATGDYYRLKQRNDVAVAYYETAAGRMRERINPTQVDLAIFPGLLQSYRVLGRLRSIDSVTGILRRDLGEGRSLRGTPKEFLRDSYFVAGSAFIDSLRYRDALEQFKNAISVDSSFAASYANIGYIYMGLERPDFALGYAQRAVALDKNDPTARNNLGFALFLHGEYRQAIEHLEASYLAAPSLLTVINLGLAHRFAGNLPGAVRWHTEAVKEAKGNRSTEEWYAGGAWRYSYTPQRAGDRQTIKHSILVTDLSHKRAVATFALSLDEAVSGKLPQAEAHFIEATKLASEPEFRCFFANEIVATRNRLKKMSISTDVRRWLEAMRGQLVRGAACPV